MKKELSTAEEAENFAETLSETEFAIDMYKSETGFVVQWVERKMYSTFDGKEYPDEAWVTKENQLLLIQDISPEHCRNILRMIIRNERTLREQVTNMINTLTEFEKLTADVEFEGFEGQTNLTLH